MGTWMSVRVHGLDGGALFAAVHRLHASASNSLVFGDKTGERNVIAFRDRLPGDLETESCWRCAADRRSPWRIPFVSVNCWSWSKSWGVRCLIGADEGGTVRLRVFVA
jgi:hypothetical protein